MVEVEGFILTGGASSRMGSDKAHLRLEGRAFVERIAGALAGVARRVNVVSAKADAAVWGLPVVTDVYDGCGALGGIHAALGSARAPWAMIVSCDLPFVTDQLFLRLVSLCDDAAVDAVAPRQPDGRLQPLCTLYRRDACLRVAEQLIRSGKLRPRVLLQEVRTRTVSSVELADLDGAPHFFVNVNTPDDYAHAQALGGGRSSS